MDRHHLLFRDSSERLDLSRDEIDRLIRRAHRLRSRFMARLARRWVRAIADTSGRLLRQTKRTGRRIVIALKRRRVRKSIQTS
jgi:hypothetical protein